MLRILTFVAVVAVAAAEADAQYLPGWGGGYYPFNRSIYTDQDRIPYFALHPPVYYSRPVARTYGYSPMAYPGWVQTPDVNSVEPATIVNPYFEVMPPEVLPGATVPDAGTPQLAPPAEGGTKQKQAIPEKTKSVPSKKTSTGNKAAANVRPLRIVNPYASRLVAGRQ